MMVFLVSATVVYRGRVGLLFARPRATGAAPAVVLVPRPVAPPAVVLAPRSAPLLIVTAALSPVVVVAAAPAAAPVPRPRAVPPPPPGERDRDRDRERSRAGDGGERLAVGAHDHVLQRGGRRGRAPRSPRPRRRGVLGAAHDAEDAADVFRSAQHLFRRPAEALQHAAGILRRREARLLFVAHLAFVRQGANLLSGLSSG